MLDNLTEKEIARIWQDQLLDGDKLATENGEPLRIIYPGRLNDDQGADFRDAVIVTGRGLMRGDVEVHLRSSGWLEHRHHQDASYNRVILHVVLWHNTKTATRLQSGREIPLLALDKYVDIQPSQRPALASSSSGSNLPCRQIAGRLTRDTAAEFLDRAGEERFLMKSSGFKRDLARVEAGQSLYQGIMGALGYSRNKPPFLELARRLPLRLLESVTPGKLSDTEWLLRRQATLLRTAGLLPRHYQPSRLNGLGDKGTERLVKLGASFPRTRIMSLNDWHLLRVRPNNSPWLRLIAMSYLLLRYREKGWLEGLTGLVIEASLSQGCHKRLEAGLVVTVDDFPSGCLDSATGGRVIRLSPLGRQRAADIIVNVLLPFTFAWSRSTAQPELGGKALDLYRLYPRLAVNSVEKQMTEQLGLNSSLVNSARRQQGLIHIYKNLCTLGRCSECLFGKIKPGDTLEKTKLSGKTWQKEL